MDREKEYEILTSLEIETTKTRLQTFTAILSISFILPSLSLQANSDSVLHFFSYQISLSQLVFFMGYLFYLFALFHYAWYHRYAHIYRRALKDLEKELNIMVYRHRVRPQIGRLKLHFDWALYIMGLIYGFITAKFVGWIFFLIGIAVVFILYSLLLLASFWQTTEPLEK
ncbi:MAG: hypothetical protein ACE5IW_05870 [bacterium]